MRLVIAPLLAAILLAGLANPGKAAQLTVEIAPGSGDPAHPRPAHPRMGDRLTLRSTIRNVGPDAASGIIAWLSLLQVDPGKEQPLDLEDWSAQKAVTLPALAPGQVVETEWPIRLIQAGSFRAAVVAAEVGGNNAVVAPTASRFAGFVVATKPVVESGRVLPVALGLPLLLGAVLLWRIRGSRSADRRWKTRPGRQK